ncbi:MAG: CopG family transcriptional regulator [Deltaproteobacteria bacterium]|nr:CopG family transcriptional regulator [Deltaproteobacteria bacterium]MBM4324121.1 CopG family transcriptional regulator [Deltaproteobacteria bacterium]MBM4347246.1 CopG family transcriptional regulator [Deltaproteobacteria bacterium]
MPLSVRLDKKTDSLLQQTASTLKTSKAEVIKKSLSDYCARVLSESRKRPYELIKDLLDKRGSGEGDLSARGEEILRERFRRKT